MWGFFCVFFLPIEAQVSGYEFASQSPSLSPQTHLNTVFQTFVITLAISACSGKSAVTLVKLQARNTHSET